MTVDHGCMVMLNSTTVFVIGGNLNKIRSDRTFYLSKDKRIWTEGPKLPIQRECFACARIKYNKVGSRFSVIVAAGWDGANYLSSSEVLDLETGKWRPGPELPILTRCSPMVEDEEGGVILVGGESKVEKTTKLFRLPHAGDGSKWTELPQKLKTGRSRHVAMLLPDNLVSCN